MGKKKKKKLGGKNRVFMHFDGSLFFVFESRTRREERWWRAEKRRKKSKWGDEENGKADNPVLSVRNFDEFCLCYEV